MLYLCYDKISVSIGDCESQKAPAKDTTESKEG